MPVSILLKKYYVQYKINKRKENLSEAFRDVLYCISGSVASGRRLPAAVEDAHDICKKMYGEESDISEELRFMVRASRQSNARTIDLLSDFANRSDIDEIKQFSMALYVCSSNGGDIEDVCLRSSKLLLDKIDFQNEIKTLISQKKTDVMLLTSMPIVILIYLNLTNYGYISVLYSGISGRLIMSLCLALIATALIWGMKIINLKL